MQARRRAAPSRTPEALKERGGGDAAGPSWSDMRPGGPAVQDIHPIDDRAPGGALKYRYDGSGVKLKSGRERMASTPPRRSIRAC